jgi:hypothetical protein
MIRNTISPSTVLPAVRRHGFPKGIPEPFWLFNNDAALKAHPRYKEAKAGGKESAVELVSDLALDCLIKIMDKLPVGAIYVAPHAREATGDNAIPQVLASACAIIAHGEAESDIVQVTRVFHGGSIAAVVVLVNAGRTKQFQPTRSVIRKLEERYENEIEEIFGIIPGALTANEANYLIGFKSADEIRNRLVKARKETDLRLRSKGIEQKD